MDPLKKIVRVLFNSISKDLKGSADFLRNLRDEDDWSFVVKSHAYVEALLADLLSNKIGDSRLKKVFRRIDISSEDSGKLAFTKALELLTKNQRRFVRSLSALRNRLLHNVEMLNFSLAAHVKQLDSAAKKAWQDDLIWFDLSEQEKQVWNGIAVSNPKTMLWFSVSLFALIVRLDIREFQMTNDLRSLSNRNGMVRVQELLKLIANQSPAA